jgi:hypothetical protein
VTEQSTPHILVTPHLPRPPCLAHSTMSSKDAVFDQVEEHVKGLKIHAMISSEFDADHQAALSIPLGTFAK